MLRRLSLVLGVFLTTSCAAATSSARPVVSGAGRNVITATEIVASSVTDVYQAVSQLRPEFLRRRALTALPNSSVAVMVYVDGVRLGGAELLRFIPLDEVRLIRYIGAHEADLRWGRNHPAGVILVTTSSR